MAAAIKRITDRGLDLNATYGSMHRSGDRGSAGYPLGGGLGDADRRRERGQQRARATRSSTR